MRRMEMRLMQRMYALEAKMMEAIGKQQSQNEHKKNLRDPEDSNILDSKR